MLMATECEAETQITEPFLHLETIL